MDSEWATVFEQQSVGAVGCCQEVVLQHSCVGVVVCGCFSSVCTQQMTSRLAAARQHSDLICAVHAAFVCFDALRCVLCFVQVSRCSKARARWTRSRRYLRCWAHPHRWVVCVCATKDMLGDGGLIERLAAGGSRHQAHVQAAARCCIPVVGSPLCMLHASRASCSTVRPQH